MIRKLLAWGAVLAAAAVYTCMLTVTLPHLSNLAGGVPVFDLRPGGYSFAEAKEILLALGDAGRRYYLEVQQPLDTLFPILNAATVAIVLMAAFPQGNWRYFQLGRVQHALLLIAICLPVALFDLLENLTVRELLLTDPAALSAETVATASRFSVIKSVAVTFAYSFALVGLIFLLADKVRTKRNGMRSA